MQVVKKKLVHGPPRGRRRVAPDAPTSPGRHVKRKRGRPRADINGAKTVRTVSTILSEVDYKRLASLAAKRGITVSALIRALVKEAK